MPFRQPTTSTIVGRNLYYAGPFTTIPTSGSTSFTKYDSYTKILTHLSTDIFDSQTPANVMTASGHAALNSTTAKFGAQSVYFDTGGDDALTTGIISNGNFNFGSGDFSIEAWVNPSTLTHTYSMFAAYLNTSGLRSWGLAIKGSTGLSFYYSPNGSGDSWVDSTFAFSTGQWYHCACSRTGGKMYFFVNGTLLNVGGTTMTATLVDQTLPFTIGRFGEYAYADLAFNGYIQEVRISKGIARWTSSFTAPTTPYAFTE